MRIAIITQGYLTGGGVPAIAKWLRQGLTDHGHDVHVHDLAASSRDAWSMRLLSPHTWFGGIQMEDDSRDSGMSHWGADWVELESQRYRPRQRLTDALNGYDLIQVVAGGPALALAASEAKPPKVLQVATTLLSERRAHLPGMRVHKRVVKTVSLRRLHRMEVEAVRSVDEVLVENRQMLDWVRSCGQMKVGLIPPGIDVEAFRPGAQWDPARPIIALGRLGDSRKDWPTAIRAYEILVESTTCANDLLVAGKGPVTPDLRAAIEASPVRERIRVRLDVPQENLPSLLAGGSVFLQSSLEEGLGLAGLEAMACGLPVVATKTVGSSEYVRDGVNGYLVDLGEGASEGLAEALRLVLSGSTGTRLSENARRTVEREYSSDAALRGFLEVYERLQSVRAAGGRWTGS